MELLSDQNQQMALQAVRYALMNLSASDQAAFLDLVHTLTIGANAAARAARVAMMDSGDGELYTRCAAVFTALDAAKAAGISGVYLDRCLDRFVNDPGIVVF